MAKIDRVGCWELLIRCRRMLIHDRSRWQLVASCGRILIDGLRGVERRLLIDSCRRILVHDLSSWMLIDSCGRMLIHDLSRWLLVDSCGRMLIHDRSRWLLVDSCGRILIDGRRGMVQRCRGLLENARRGMMHDFGRLVHGRSSMLMIHECGELVRRLLLKLRWIVAGRVVRWWYRNRRRLVTCVLSTQHFRVSIRRLRLVINIFKKCFLDCLSRLDIGFLVVGTCENCFVAGALETSLFTEILGYTEYCR